MKKLHIVMYAGALRHWGHLDPRSMFEDLPSPAGTELAMMRVARSLAERGHRVSVFAACEAGTHDGVDYIDADLAVPLLTTLQTDVVVSWQDAGIFLHPLKTRLRVLMSQSANLTLGAAADRVDRYFGISRFSGKTLLDSDAYADPAKMWLTRNSIYKSVYAAGDDLDTAKMFKDPHSMVWMSSPDRGLHHLLDIFPKVRAQVPDATLTILYNFDKTLESYRQNQPGSAFVRWLDKAAELKQVEGVTVLNHVSQPVLARILDRTQVLAYPCDPIRATETYCNALTEAMAAGCATIISDADCLPENYGKAATVLPRPIDPGAWAARIVELMTNEASWRAAAEKGFALASVCDAGEVAWEWECFFESYLAGAEVGPDMSLAARLDRKLPAALAA